MTIPANEACATPSPMNDSLRNTTKVPSVEHRPPTTQRGDERALHEVVMERGGEGLDHRSPATIVAVSVSSIEM